MAHNVPSMHPKKFRGRKWFPGEREPRRAGGLLEMNLPVVLQRVRG